MRRAVEKYLEDGLAEELLRGTIQDNKVVDVSYDGEKITFSQKKEGETETVSK